MSFDFKTKALGRYQLARIVEKVALATQKQFNITTKPKSTKGVKDK